MGWLGQLSGIHKERLKFGEPNISKLESIYAMAMPSSYLAARRTQHPRVTLPAARSYALRVYPGPAGNHPHAFRPPTLSKKAKMTPGYVLIYRT